MGLAFPLAFLLTAAAWLIVATAIVLTWLPRFTRSNVRVWRIVVFLNVSLCLLPAGLSCAATIDALKYGGSIFPPLMIFVVSLLAPLACLFMLRRATILASRSPLTNGSSDRGVASSVSQGKGR